MWSLLSLSTEKKEVTPEQIRQMLLQSRQAAAVHMDKIRENPQMPYEPFHEELFAYIKCKFHLTDEDCTTDNYKQLSEISLSKSMRISPELVKEYDLARSCDGVSSVHAKMILLLMSVQRELGITLPPRDTAYAETVPEITRLVWNIWRESRQSV